MTEPLVKSLHVSGYRSIRHLFIRFGGVTVIEGANGCGKSNLCHALCLVQSAATGSLARRINQEGGLDSVCFSGQVEVKKELRVEIEWTDAVYGFGIGVRPVSEFSPFPADPQFKDEKVFFNKICFVDRGFSVAKVRDHDGSWTTEKLQSDSESVFDQVGGLPIIDRMKRRIESWRFYHQFRVDRESPLRATQVKTITPCLAEDGSNWISALETSRWGGSRELACQAMDKHFRAALPDFLMKSGEGGIEIWTPGLTRPTTPLELSDGTLRFLGLLAALSAFRPPPLIVLNEPEANLNPNLLRPLADLVAEASKHSQILVTTHSEEFARFLVDSAGARLTRLTKEGGETKETGHQNQAYYSEEE